jgi:hypothetical protein
MMNLDEFDRWPVPWREGCLVHFDASDASGWPRSPSRWREGLGAQRNGTKRVRDVATLGQPCGSSLYGAAHQNTA